MTAMDCYSSMYWLSPGTRVSYALSWGRLSAPDARCCRWRCLPLSPASSSASLPFALPGLTCTYSSSEIQYTTATQGGGHRQMDK